MRCLTSSRFNMFADILRQGTPTPPPSDANEEFGHWEEQQDPLTHEIIRVWVPATDVPDNPATPEDESLGTIPCIARGIVDGGIRVAGTTERWGELYQSVDYVRMVFPKGYALTDRDRVTNIRDKYGNIIWLDEEVDVPGQTYRATVFDVLGVTPIPDPFGRHIENVAMLQKAEAYV